MAQAEVTVRVQDLAPVTTLIQTLARTLADWVAEGKLAPDDPGVLRLQATLEGVGYAPERRCPACGSVLVEGEGAYCLGCSEDHEEVPCEKP